MLLKFTFISNNPIDKIFFVNENTLLFYFILFYTVDSLVAMSKRNKWTFPSADLELHSMCTEYKIVCSKTILSATIIKSAAAHVFIQQKRRNKILLSIKKIQNFNHEIVPDIVFDAFGFPFCNFH